tara:strand:+ start:10 stop:933 length:924 start_codon:yes stop_codon:yes gene_type:complete
MSNIYDKVWEANAGEFYDASHYDKIITESEYGFNRKGEVLFCFIKGAIKEENRRKYADIIRGCCKTKTKNRGASAGECDLRYFPKKAVELCDKNGDPYTDGKKRYSVYYKDATGKVVNRCQSNQVRSGVAGFFDKVAGLPCRKVGWSNRNPLKHNALIELAREIENNHKEKCETSYKYHRKKADEVSGDMLFDGTIYSTMTLNYDFRTASHQDKGDLQGGLSTLTIFEEVPDNYTKFYLGLPEYKIAFDVRDGDTLIFNAHEYHANTEFEVKTDRLKVDDLTGNNFAGRMSCVCYLRDRLNACGDKV